MIHPDSPLKIFCGASLGGCRLELELELEGEILSTNFFLLVRVKLQYVIYLTIKYVKRSRTKHLVIKITKSFKKKK